MSYHGASGKMQKDKLVYSTDKQVYQREKDKLVYSTDKEVQRIGLDEARVAIQRAIKAQDQRAYERVLLDMGADPETESFRARVASFRRNCNLD